MHVEAAGRHLLTPGLPSACSGDSRETADPAPRPGEGKMSLQVPYSNIETLAVSFETVRLEAVSLEAVRLGKEGFQTYKL